MQECSINQDVHVVSLKDSKKCATASSAGSMNTVILLDKLRFQEGHKELPAVVVTQCVTGYGVRAEEETDSNTATRSKSPSSKSHSTLTTIHENHNSFKSGDSPLRNIKGSIFYYYLFWEDQGIQNITTLG